MKDVTVPVAPWDIPDVDDWDRTPDEITIERARQANPQPKKKKVINKLPANKCTPIHALVGRTFMGHLNVSDLDYMAKAILQVLDEMHELRERVRILEGGDK